jgi:hypothetical protein
MGLIGSFPYRRRAPPPRGIGLAISREAPVWRAWRERFKSRVSIGGLLVGRAAGFVEGELGLASGLAAGRGSGTAGFASGADFHWPDSRVCH